MRPGERGTAAEQLANLRRAVIGLAAAARRARTGDHARQRPAGRQRAVAPGARGRRGTGSAAVAGRCADASGNRCADRRGAPPGARRPARSPVCSRTCRVAADDPAFDRPTKPIGPFYSADQGEQLERERGWAMVSDANRGHRRVVPSPDPLEIVELEVIRTLAEQNTVVIACGGGGIPVVRRGNRLAGIDAVIDKDRASALLARGLEAERLLILTEVPAVYRQFRRARSGGDPRTVGRRGRDASAGAGRRLDAAQGRGGAQRSAAKRSSPASTRSRPLLPGTPEPGSTYRLRSREWSPSQTDSKGARSPASRTGAAKSCSRCSTSRTSSSDFNGPARSTTCCPVARSG